MADQEPTATNTRDPLEALSDVFDQKVAVLGSVLKSVEERAKSLARNLGAAEEEKQQVSARLSRTEEAAARLVTQNGLAEEREQMLRHELAKLRAMMEAERMRFTMHEHKLQQLLAEERIHAERMSMLRDDAVRQRDDTVAELATAYADMDAMQATLADSAVYVRYLRKKVLELEMENSRAAARSAQQHQQQQDDGAGVFSMSSIKSAIEAAVRDACSQPADEKRKRLKALQLRWHPDKNPVLAELATEVTKLINEAVAAAESKT